MFRLVSFSTLISVLIFTWLVILHATTAARLSLLRFYFPKVLLAFVLWLTLVADVLKPAKELKLLVLAITFACFAKITWKVSG